MRSTGGKALEVEPVKDLYIPPIAHEVVADDPDEHNIYRIEIDGVIVRYVESFGDVQMTVEGALAEEAIDVLVRDLNEKLAALEGVEYVVEEIP